MQEEHQSLPNTDRLSVLAASVLLAYALLPFITLPDRSLLLQISGILFEFKINFATVVTVISAGLAASGTDWLVHDHPRLGHKPTFPHWIIPAMTAWVIGVPLSNLSVNLQWWVVFGFGALLLVMILISEYIAVDPTDARHPPVAVGLTAMSYALFLILVITLVGVGVRLYLLLPALGLAILLVTLRNLYLRLGERWCFRWSVAISLVVVQIAAALHYLPLSPLRFGLLILGLAYALASIAGSIEEGRAWRTLWVEPVIMLAILWGLAMFVQG